MRLNARRGLAGGSFIGLIACIAMAAGPHGEMAAAGVQPQRPPAESATSDTEIVVNGGGSVMRQPTQATVFFRAENQGNTSQEAQAATSAQMEKLIAALKKLNVAGAELQTQGLRLRAVHETFEGHEADDGKVVGYLALNSLRVRIDDVTKVGLLIDTAVATGPNEFGGVNFDLRDDQPARDEAATKAAQHARHQADVLAAAMGLRIVGIKHIGTPGGGGQSPFSGSYSRSPEPTPIEVSEVEISEYITVTFRAEPLAGK